ncbi:MAG TPA: helix-turn-helix domain-containing protein [Polyangiaceae bacterium]|nr:helix-turn-helix domain-containing protein [Polyangiaceae bacterium]
MKRRRRVDWPYILGEAQQTPSVLERPVTGELGAVLSACNELATLDDPDAAIRKTVEIARRDLGFQRAGVFVFDRARSLMLGTWGTDMNGAIVDEHHIMYAVSETDRIAFQRAEKGEHFTVLQDCPLIEHRGSKTVVVGRGWVACTPIRSAGNALGIFFNDAGGSNARVSTTKQAHAAVLCAFLGTRLDLVRASRRGSADIATSESSTRRLTTAAAAMMAKDPALGGKELAAELDVSLAKLMRVFKAEMGVSLGEYRNRIRLDRFTVLLDTGERNLLQAALAAGFGSYAQFHRVFRAFRHLTPRDYLRRQA